MKPTEYLVRVVAPHFVAGLVIDEALDKCVSAAPILRWAIGKPPAELRDYFRMRQWPATVVRNGV
jgi:hypothetical protein